MTQRGVDSGSATHAELVKRGRDLIARFMDFYTAEMTHLQHKLEARAVQWAPQACSDSEAPRVAGSATRRSRSGGRGGAHHTRTRRGPRLCANASEPTLERNPVLSEERAMADPQSEERTTPR